MQNIDQKSIAEALFNNIKRSVNLYLKSNVDYFEYIINNVLLE